MGSVSPVRVMAAPVTHNYNMHVAMGEGTKLKDEDSKLIINSHQFKRYLKRIPDDELNFFVSYLLPTDSAVNVITHIRNNDGNKSDKLSLICEAFLHEKDASWTKVCGALRETEDPQCTNLAKIIEATFL